MEAVWSSLLVLLACQAGLLSLIAWLLWRVPPRAIPMTRTPVPADSLAQPDYAEIGSFLPSDGEQAALAARLESDSRQRAGTILPFGRSSPSTMGSPMADSRAPSRTP